MVRVMFPARPYAIWIAVSTALVVAAGCGPRRRSFVPPQDPNTLSDVAFLHYLPTVPVVTVDEGFRAVLLVAGGADAASTFDARRAALVRRAAVDDTWPLVEDQLLDNGTLAYMLSRICDLPRGVNERLARMTGWGRRRYALRTCVHEGLMTYGPAHAFVTGGALLAAVTAADEYLDRRRTAP